MAQLIAREPWGVDVDPLPGAVFHAVVSGGCWLRISGRAPLRLMPGDVVLLPTNTPHALVPEVDGRTMSFGPLEKEARLTADGDVLIHGPGARTRILCASYDYRSEYAFSRAFARHRGRAPGRYRVAARERRADARAAA